MREKLQSSHDLRVCHIDDIWNSERHCPDPEYPIVIFPSDGDEEYRFSIADAELFQTALSQVITEAKLDKEYFSQILEIVSQYEKAGVHITIEQLSKCSMTIPCYNLGWHVRRLAQMEKIQIDVDFSDFKKSKLRLKWPQTGTHKNGSFGG